MEIKATLTQNGQSRPYADRKYAWKIEGPNACCQTILRYCQENLMMCAHEKRKQVSLFPYYELVKGLDDTWTYTVTEPYKD